MWGCSSSLWESWVCSRGQPQGLVSGAMPDLDPVSVSTDGPFNFEPDARCSCRAKVFGSVQWVEEGAVLTVDGSVGAGCVSTRDGGERLSKKGDGEASEGELQEVDRDRALENDDQAGKVEEREDEEEEEDGGNAEGEQSGEVEHKVEGLEEERDEDGRRI